MTPETDRFIADYALLSDCHSCALVSSSGSVDWLCLPHFDSPSMFGRLLDPAAGHWSQALRAEQSSRRRYLPQTMVLESTSQCASGELECISALALGAGERGHSIGKRSPHCLIRTLHCTRGTIEVDVQFAPRAEYGLVAPLLRAQEGGLYARAGSGQLFLSTPSPLEVRQNIAYCTVRLQAGQSAHFCLQFEKSLDVKPSAWSQDQIACLREETIEAWKSWSRLHQNYDGPWRDLVAHSGRVLQALTYTASGAIVAAATTSLPEALGGERNWDYRYTWVRDASFTLQALWVAACPREANAFFSFLAEAALTQVRSGTDLQIMFGIRGEHDLTERNLPHLRGWRGCTPVRVGNGAWNQRQFDVYGELLGAVYTLKDQLQHLDAETREFLIALVDAAAARWTQPDQGIWEIRGEPRHFLYSKLMCWVALDRGIKLADDLGSEHRTPHWCRIRDEIANAILTRGWSERADAFTQAFGQDDLDASALMIPITGFLPGSDPRVLATIRAIATRLTDSRGLVFRYLAEDGLGGREGSFLLCTFWLAQAQALAGQLDAARKTFEHAAGFANDVGLLAEEVLPETGELLGNFPQAFSHIGLVNAAWAISHLESEFEASSAPASPGSGLRP